MKMKKWMALSCAAAMVLSTFPVSADEAVNEDVSGSITVWEHAYSFEEALKAVIEGFKAKYPNVEVDYEIKASDYQQVLGRLFSPAKARIFSGQTVRLRISCPAM